MFVIFWTTRNAAGQLQDSYEVTESENAAMARARQLAQRDGVYAWGVAPIARASEPHWESAL
jgi:hypothetical protein